ncbi:MAG: YbhN family protein [Thermoleophilaceae bacterium]
MPNLRQRLREHPYALTVLALAFAATAVLGIAGAYGFGHVGDALDQAEPAWLALIAAAEVVSYTAYVVAYRSIACVQGHDAIPTRVAARVVAAGFGPLAAGGGFALDKQALHALHSDEDAATVGVVGLGVLEWALLAPAACICAIAMLFQDGDGVWPSVLWPWAIAVPAGFALGLIASTNPVRPRVCRLFGNPRWLGHLLEGVATLHTLVAQPRTFARAWIGTTVYWAADIAALYGGLRMFGVHPTPGMLIIGYATGYAATRRSLPLAGAGVTEALMTYSLHWVGVPVAQALCAVVAYRVFNFLLVLPPALAARGRVQPLLDAARERRALTPTERRLSFGR